MIEGQVRDLRASSAPLSPTLTSHTYKGGASGTLRRKRTKNVLFSHPLKNWSRGLVGKWGTDALFVAERSTDAYSLCFDQF